MIKCSIDKYKTKGNKMDNRNRNEADELMGLVIGALDEDRVLEYIIAGMTTTDKIDLVDELREQISPERGPDAIAQTLEDLLMYIEKFGEGNSSEDMRMRQLDCIWKLSGGKDGH